MHLKFPEKSHMPNSDSLHLVRRLSENSVTTKQWAVLHAVVSCGSYASAAELLHISQPAISYIISKMEEQIGIPLLKLEGRKAKITETGLKLLRRSETLLREAFELETYIKEMRDAKRAKVTLAVNEEFPAKILFQALGAYSKHNREAAISLIQGHSEKIQAVLQRRMADLAIDTCVPQGFKGELLIETNLLLVAHPQHPLFSLGRSATRGDLDKEIQILYEPHHQTYTGTTTITPISDNFWVLSSIDAALAALAEGLGYGWMPEHRVQSSISKGQLKMLLLNEEEKKSRFYLIRSSAPLPDAVHFANVLQHIVGEANFLVH